MGAPNVGSSAISKLFRSRASDTPLLTKCQTVGPDGRILSAAQTANEELIIADLDLSLVTKAKTFADASGHCECSNEGRFGLLN